jgi:antitoxin component YwqK of YwqJK toxin-antitoxin module
MKNLSFIALFAVLILMGTIVAQPDSLSADEAAIADNIKLLRSENSETREAAAKELRRIIAKYPSGTTNIRDKDGGEAFWMQKVGQIVPSMVKSEVTKILPPSTESPEGMGAGSGQSHSDHYRLDNIWMVRIAYQNPDVVLKVAELIKRHLEFYVEPPKDFTGTWTGWYVNGQKAVEVQFKDRKYHGTFTKFHDNGRKWTEQFHVNGEGDGPGYGWYPDGKVSYTLQYKNGKQDGASRHFYPDGRKRSEFNFKDGKFHGLMAQWYENGQMRVERNYKDGVQHGTEASWSEEGKLHYKREYRDGKVAE